VELILKVKNKNLLLPSGKEKVVLLVVFPLSFVNNGTHGLPRTYMIGVAFAPTITVEFSQKIIRKAPVQIEFIVSPWELKQELQHQSQTFLICWKE